MITLSSPVKNLKGVGPAKAAALRRLGITTVDDILHHFPSGYTFAPPVTNGPLIEGQRATIVGIVWSVRVFERNFEATFSTGVRVIWFGGRYLRDSIFPNSILMVSGIVTYDGFVNPAWKVYKGAGEEGGPYDASDVNTVTYPATSGVTSKNIERLIQQVLTAMPTVVPQYRAIHRPRTQAEADEARNFFKYAELFYMQLALALRQAKRTRELPNIQCVISPHRIADYFPFSFTEGQQLAIASIKADLCRPWAMNRLLQGDVGSGKTAVAAYVAIVVAFNRGQTAILCPTEILARQHYETVKGYFERAGAQCDLVVGGRASSNMNLTADIVVGTTALLSDTIRWRNLGLVIIDEQHKFGVEQRAALRRQGNPHVLVMTATPIPRTMAMTVFGDLDVSTIRDMPPGRRPVETCWYTRLDWRAAERIRKELSAGRQVYVVCPRIEALDDEMRAVKDVWQEYRTLFPDASVEILHGRMPPAKKQAVAKWWSDPTPGGRILVSTTVVEVGVDNPKATVMVIENAERFGLAQLHQLRGRVGRGPDQSYCFLLSDSDCSEARARLRVMEQTTDGFEIAEADLRQRGPGDLLSVKQHGLPDLKIADLIEDYDMLVEARKAAREMVAAGPLPPDVQVELENRFGENLYLGDAA